MTTFEQLVFAAQSAGKIGNTVVLTESNKALPASEVLDSMIAAVVAQVDALTVRPNPGDASVAKMLSDTRWIAALGGDTSPIVAAQKRAAARW